MSRLVPTLASILASTTLFCGFVLAKEPAPAPTDQPAASDKTAVPTTRKTARATTRATTGPSSRPVAKWEPADVPAIKGEPGPKNGFVKRHEGFLEDLKAKNGKVGVLFVGDSITDGWRNPVNAQGKGGKEVFEKNYGAMDPLNIGISGDRTQHVLWRLENGEVEGISPKAAVLMIGTNNLGGNTDPEIIAGITKVVRTLNAKLPTTKVLLLGVFPRGAAADNPFRPRIKAINEAIAKLDDGGKTVKYLDIGDKFLDPDGALPPAVMPDYLHPNAKGYEIWAEAIRPALDELMK